MLQSHSQKASNSFCYNATAIVKNISIGVLMSATHEAMVTLSVKVSLDGCMHWGRNRTVIKPVPGHAAAPPFEP